MHEGCKTTSFRALVLKLIPHGQVALSTPSPKDFSMAPAVSPICLHPAGCRGRSHGHRQYQEVPLNKMYTSLCPLLSYFSLERRRAAAQWDCHNIHWPLAEDHTWPWATTHTFLSSPSTLWASHSWKWEADAREMLFYWIYSRTMGEQGHPNSSHLGVFTSIVSGWFALP